LEPLVEGEEHTKKFDMNDMNTEISVSVPTDEEADDEADASQLEGGDAASVLTVKIRNLAMSLPSVLA
jgi:hypothetical protein